MNTTIKALAALITAALLAPAQAALISTRTLTDVVDFSYMEAKASGDFTTPSEISSSSYFTESTYKNKYSNAQSGDSNFKTVKSEDGKKNLFQQRYVDTIDSYKEITFGFGSTVGNYYASGTGSLSFSGTLQLNSKLKGLLPDGTNFFPTVEASANGIYDPSLYNSRTKRPSVDLHVENGTNSVYSQESHTLNIFDYPNGIRGTSASFYATASTYQGAEINLKTATSFLAKVEGSNLYSDSITLRVQSYYHNILDRNTTNADRWVTISETAVAPVPEPETYALMGMGLVGLIAARRRKVKAA